MRITVWYGERKNKTSLTKLWLLIESQCDELISVILFLCKYLKIYTLKNFKTMSMGKKGNTIGFLVVSACLHLWKQSDDMGLVIDSWNSITSLISYLII